MTTSSETASKKDVQKLQRAIVDGLEDVKAQDIQVFNTESLSPLFERVIIASGSSNRQTKALASSVRDAVREAGFSKPRTEGEENGEWIIVDCGPAVVHVMQPAIRQYYRLEEIWGATPVRLKLGAPKPAPVETAAVKRAAAKKAAAQSAAKSKAVTPAKAASQAAKAAKTAPPADAPAARAPSRKTPAKAASTSMGKPAAKTPTRAPAKKAPVKVIKVGAPAKSAPRKSTSAAAPAVRKKQPSKAS